MTLLNCELNLVPSTALLMMSSFCYPLLVQFDECPLAYFGFSDLLMYVLFFFFIVALD